MNNTRKHPAGFCVDCIGRDGGENGCCDIVIDEYVSVGSINIAERIQNFYCPELKNNNVMRDVIIKALALNMIQEDYPDDDKMTYLELIIDNESVFSIDLKVSTINVIQKTTTPSTHEVCIYY